MPFAALPVNSCQCLLNWTPACQREHHNGIGKRTQRSTAVHVSSELLAGALSLGGFRKLNDTFSSRSLAVVQDLGGSHSSDSLKQLYQIFVRGREWQLGVSACR